MQRFFVDFGTGTSLDNVYYVISTDTNIGSGGYKTDVKFAYSAGFATFTSLNQNLAMIAARLAEHSDPPSLTAAFAKPPASNQDVITKNEEMLIRELNIASIQILKDSAELQNNLQIAAAAEAKRLEDAALAKIEEAKQDLAARLDISIGGRAEAVAALKEGEKELKIAKAKVAEAARYAEQTKTIAHRLETINSALQTLDQDQIAWIAADIKAAQEEEAKYAKANEDAAAAAKDEAK
jgi:hypothetical protein